MISHGAVYEFIQYNNPFEAREVFYGLLFKIQVRHQSFHFMASESQTRELTQIQHVIIVGLIILLYSSPFYSANKLKVGLSTFNQSEHGYNIIVF